MKENKELAPCPARGEPLPEAFAAMLRDKGLLHSLNIEGEPGRGTQSLAVTLAAAALCEGEDPHRRPCGECLACRKVFAGVHPDVTVLDPAADPEAYKMRPLREALSGGWLAPSQGRAKVFLLLDIQRMERDAQNILLKVVEEPPPGTYFFFTCDNRHRLLPTILSRVATVPLALPGREEGIRRLAERVPGRTEQEYAAAWRLTGGSPEQSANLLTQPAAARRWEQAKSGVAALARGDAYGALAAITPFEKNRPDYAAFLETVAGVAANRALWGELGLDAGTAASLGLHLRDILRRSQENVYLPLASALFSGWRPGQGHRI